MLLVAGQFDAFNECVGVSVFCICLSLGLHVTTTSACTWGFFSLYDILNAS